MSDATAFTNETTKTDFTPQEALEQLVGEGKKYATVEELAKGALHAQLHISGLESNFKELQEELKNKTTTEELLKMAMEGKKPAVPDNTQSKGAPAFDQEAMLKAAKEAALQAVKDSEVSRVAGTNEARITGQLVEQYGSLEKAVEQVRNAAKSYGVSVEEFQQMARTKPAVVEALLGLKKADNKVANTSPVKSAVNTATNNKQGSAATEGTPEWWENKRANDKLYYHSVAGSKKRLEDRKRWKTQ